MPTLKSKSAARVLSQNFQRKCKANTLRCLRPLNRSGCTALAACKAADKLCAYIKCIEEEKCGNTEFREARKTLHAALLANPLPELHKFMEDYLPAFELTVDEL